MDDATIRSDSGSMPGATADAIPFGTDAFVYEPGRGVWVSSGDKLVYRGIYYRGEGKRREAIPAVAKFYALDAMEKFGRESAALAREADIGVGPRVLQVSSAVPPNGGAAAPLIIEEYVGGRLSDVLAGAAIPAAAMAGAERLHLLGDDCEDRRKQVAKLQYDLMFHVYRMHQQGMCHGDLKASNVCVHAIGANPWDVRATLIDFDLESALGSALPRERTAAYYDTLFKRVPAVLGFANELHPTRFELDLACLSAVCLEVELGCRIDAIDPHEIAKRFQETGLFEYTESGSVRAWHVDAEKHLAPRAKQAGMVPVERYFAGCSQAFLSRAMELVQVAAGGGAFLDVQDTQRIEANPAMQLIRRDDEVAHAVFDSYCASLLTAGVQPDYDSFEEQPIDLQRSCYGQAADLCEKVMRLGYKLLRAAEADDEVAAAVRFDEDQIEAMARWEHERWLKERTMMGWTFGPERDDQKKTSPYLVPYDELAEDARETRNRAPMRDTVRILAKAGLVAVPL